METASQAALATPILDSAILPKRRRNSANIGYGILLGIPAAMALIAASRTARETHSPAANFIVITYLLSFVTAVIAHELGHLLVGFAVGFRFNSFTIGPVSLFLEYGKLKLKIRRTLPAGGYAGMHLNRIWQMRRRLLLFSFGGPGANLLSAAFTYAFFAFIPMTGTWLSTFADLFVMISLLLGVANLIPFRLGVLYPDGARIWMLLTSRAKSRRWMCLAALGWQSQAGVRSRNFHRTWVNAAGIVSDGTVDEFAGNWIGYVSASDRKDAPAAASHLERCLQFIGLFGPTLRDTVALEAAVFTAWFRRNSDAAQKWLAQVNHQKALSPLAQIRAEIALQTARHAYADALTRWEDAFSFVEKLPPTPVKAKLRDGFLEWRDEIKQREREFLAAQNPDQLAAVK